MWWTSLPPRPPVAKKGNARRKMTPRDAETVTRRERIAFLLAHYSDVLAGVRDRGLGGKHVPLMCRACLWMSGCSGRRPLLLAAA